jgi:hypothetical protein
MTINNSHKPIGTNVGRNLQKQVGSTYGERRQLSNLGSNTESHVQKTRDFFAQQKGENAGPEIFSPNAQFLGTKRVLPEDKIKAIERGRRPKATVTDDMRLAFLDKIISGSGENAPPSQIKPAIKQTVRAIAGLKKPVRATGAN